MYNIYLHSSNDALPYLPELIDIIYSLSYLAFWIFVLYGLWKSWQYILSFVTNEEMRLSKAKCPHCNEEMYIYNKGKMVMFHCKKCNIEYPDWQLIDKKKEMIESYNNHEKKA